MSTQAMKLGVFVELDECTRTASGAHERGAAAAAATRHNASGASTSFVLHAALQAALPGAPLQATAAFVYSAHAQTSSLPTGGAELLPAATALRLRGYRIVSLLAPRLTSVHDCCHGNGAHDSTDTCTVHRHTPLGRCADRWRAVSHIVLHWQSILARGAFETQSLAPVEATRAYYDAHIVDVMHVVASLHGTSADETGQYRCADRNAVETQLAQKFPEIGSEQARYALMHAVAAHCVIVADNGALRVALSEGEKVDANAAKRLASTASECDHHHHHHHHEVPNHSDTGHVHSHAPSRGARGGRGNGGNVASDARDEDDDAGGDTGYESDGELPELEAVRANAAPAPAVAAGHDEELLTADNAELVTRLGAEHEAAVAAVADLSPLVDAKSAVSARAVELRAKSGASTQAKKVLACAIVRVDDASCEGERTAVACVDGSALVKVYDVDSGEKLFDLSPFGDAMANDPPHKAELRTISCAGRLLAVGSGSACFMPGHFEDNTRPNESSLGLEVLEAEKRVIDVYNEKLCEFDLLPPDEAELAKKNAELNKNAPADKPVKPTDTENRERTKRLKELTDLAAKAGQLEDGSVMAGGHPGYVYVFDSLSRECLASIQCPAGYTLWISPSTTKPRLIAGDMIGLQVWDWTEDECMYRLQIDAIALDADDKLIAAGSARGYVFVLDANDGQYTFQIPHFMHDDIEVLNSVALAPKHILAAYDKGNVRGFGRSNGVLQFTVSLSSSPLESICLASPQIAIVGDSNGDAHVIDTAFGKHLRSLRANASVGEGASTNAVQAAGGGKKKKKKKGGAAAASASTSAASDGAALAWATWGFAVGKEAARSHAIYIANGSSDTNCALNVWRASIL